MIKILLGEINETAPVWFRDMDGMGLRGLEVGSIPEQEKCLLVENGRGCRTDRGGVKKRIN